MCGITTVSENKIMQVITWNPNVFLYTKIKETTYQGSFYPIINGCHEHKLYVDSLACQNR